ncbi:toxin-antitoxin system YwqK family antitoxin [Dysgonomonas sp. 521]|uniref:toxin-antitoxin system YwqK family antitoxin n=1 Tax=Dysgonomonas sp. 521 TaxID=2302932 RepID=UPI0013D572CA|nr:toxin-antitoxin system YwqK family antitoxin [Dysgonomonas sp. 521]NDV94962.1 toxin-antitoxin system YwqK family antitoxin [Dysgonomonas sp. 521]
MKKINITLICTIVGIMISTTILAQKTLRYSSIVQTETEDGRTKYFDANNEKPLNGEYKVEGSGIYRDAYYTAKYKKGFITGLLTDYDKRGRKQAERSYVDGCLTLRKEFDYDGKVSRIIHFKNNMPDGTDTEYFADGTVSRETHYKQGRQDGTEIKYDFTTRKLSYSKNYVDGLLDGNQMESRWSDKYENYIIESVYDMGKVVSLKETYDNGTLKKIREIKPDGSYIEKSYLRDSSPESTFSYNSEGQSEGVQTYYFPDGKVKIASPYRNGQKDGTRKEFYENGQLKTEESYSNGDKQGAWNEYYPNGQKKTEWLCDRNRYNGPYKIYYEDGKVQEEGETKYEQYVYRKIYYKNGQLKSHIVHDSARGLVEIESYDQDGKQL